MSPQTDKLGDYLDVFSEFFGECKSVVLSGWEEGEGITVFFVVMEHRNGGRPRILVTCPVCGGAGRLVVRKRASYGRGYRIVHDSKKRGCAVSYFSQGYLAVNRIYSRVQSYLEGRRILRLTGGKRPRSRIRSSGESLSVYR